MFSVLTDLYYSPIVRAFAVCSAVFVVLFWAVGSVLMNDVLDGFVITGCLMVLWRYSTEAIGAIRARNPDGWQILLVSVAGVSFAIAALRLLRYLGLSLGFIDSKIVGYLFGAITFVMMFSIYLKVVSPQLHLGSRVLPPWVALGIALMGGAILSVLLLIVRQFP